MNPANNQVNYSLGINGGSFSFEHIYGNTAYRGIQSGNIISNTWQTLHVTVDSSLTRIFIDNQEVFSGNGIAGLLPLSGNITVGENYLGDMDNLSVKINSHPLFEWNFNQARGETNAADSSGNNLNGVLTGGDTKVHYFGILPTPTKFILPTLSLIRRITMPVLPTTTSSGGNTNPPTDPNFTPWPTSGSIRSNRPQLPR